MKAEASHKCFYCGVRTDDLQADHVIPVSRGGSSMAWNMVVSCRRCNQTKGTRTGWEFVPVPGPEQEEKFELIDRLMERSRVAFWERRKLVRGMKLRAKAGAKKRSDLARLKGRLQSAVRQAWAQNESAWPMYNHVEVLRCSTHRAVETVWRCSRCQTPICASCVGEVLPSRDYVCRPCSRSREIAP